MVALGQSHGILEVEDAPVVAGQHHVLPLCAVVYVVELMLQLMQVARGGGNVLFGVVHLVAG